MTSLVREVILAVINTRHEVVGIFHLGYSLVGCHDLSWVRKQLHTLEQQGEIELEPHGSGRPTIIRKAGKRNRNSAGYPRRVRP